jgi:hypothetical protein
LALTHSLSSEEADKRKGEGVYSMADIGLSALSLFSVQSESFLSYQRSLEEGRKTSNCHTLFGMANIPTDNHIRSMPVHPSHLQSSFDQAIAELRGNGDLKTFQRFDGWALIALDGTEFFCSQKLGCPNGQTRKRANGKLESYHSMLAATLVAPGHNMALPLIAGVHRQTGRRRQAGLRRQRRKALPGRPWRADQGVAAGDGTDRVKVRRHSSSFANVYWAKNWVGDELCASCATWDCQYLCETKRLPLRLSRSSYLRFPDLLGNSTAASGTFL